MGKMPAGQGATGTRNIVSISLSRPALRHICLVLLVTLCVSSPALGGLQRRMNAGIYANYYRLDSDFFGMKSGLGALLVFRYEIADNIYFENALGTISSKADGLRINGMNYHFDVFAILPVLIPYRPVVRAGVGFISVNPLTATPTETYRPAQTAFYLIGGTGMTRSFRENIVAEVSADLYFTPYPYRIYEFDRIAVVTRDARFLHIAISIGVSYSF